MDNTFSDEEDLKLHIQVKHRKICDKCDSCNNTFSDEQDLELHMKVNHANKVPNTIGAKQIICDSFSLNYNLENHFKNVHGNRKDFLCINCGNCFETLQQKDWHGKMCEKNVQKQFLCDFCGKNFTTNYNKKKPHQNCS